MNFIAELLKKLQGSVDKVPLKGNRTVIVAVGMVVCAISGLLTGTLTVDQAAGTIATALGLIFAAKHKPEE